MIKKLVIILLTITFAYTQDSIIDVSRILKDNQAVVINAKTNSIEYVLEILPNGKIIKKYINKKGQDGLIKELNLNDTLQNNTTNTRKSPITNWDKKRIIYEQKVEKIDINR